MIVQWFFYLFWAAMVAVSIWGIFKYEDISKTMLHVPIIATASFIYFAVVFIFNHGPEGIFTPDMTLSSTLLGIWLPVAIFILGSSITSLMYLVYGLFNFKFASLPMLVCGSFLMQGILSAAHVVFKMPSAGAL